MKSEIAIIMPTYNGDKFLKEQIQSILNQTHHDFNLYIFDDKSNDSTLDICKKFKKIDSRIHLYINKENKGVVKNINDALLSIQANYYFLSDQDDIWLPKKIEKQLSILKNNLCIMTFSNLLLIDENGKSLNTDFWTTQKIDSNQAKNPENIAIKTIVTGCTMAFNASLLEVALPISEKATMHDHWLSIIASSIGKIIPIKEKLVHYRQHQKNIIGAHNSKNITRQVFYKDCYSYSKFKYRKKETFIELMEMLISINDTLGKCDKRNNIFELYKKFYESLINEQWFIAFKLSIKMKNVPGSNTFLRILISFYFLPVIFIICKLLFFINRKNS